MSRAERKRVSRQSYSKGCAVEQKTSEEYYGKRKPMLSETPSKGSSSSPPDIELLLVRIRDGEHEERALLCWKFDISCIILSFGFPYLPIVHLYSLILSPV